MCCMYNYLHTLCLRDSLILWLFQYFVLYNCYKVVTLTNESEYSSIYTSTLLLIDIEVVFSVCEANIMEISVTIPIYIFPPEFTHIS